MTSTPHSIPFTIVRKIEGDQVSGAEFVIQSLHMDSAALLANAVDHETTTIHPQTSVAGKEIQVTLPPMATQSSNTKPVITDTTRIAAKPKETQVLQSNKPGNQITEPKKQDTINPTVTPKKPEIPQANPEVTTLHTKPADTISMHTKIKPPEQIPPTLPDTNVNRVRGYSIQIGAFHVKAYALTAQRRLSESFARPVLIVFEDGYYKVRITGFMHYNEAKKFIPQLINSGFPDTYLLKSH